MRRNAWLAQIVGKECSDSGYFEISRIRFQLANHWNVPAISNDRNFLLSSIRSFSSKCSSKWIRSNQLVFIIPPYRLNAGLKGLNCWQNLEFVSLRWDEGSYLRNRFEATRLDSLRGTKNKRPLKEQQISYKKAM